MERPKVNFGQDIECPSCKRTVIKPFEIDLTIESVMCPVCKTKIRVVWSGLDELDEKRVVH